MFENDFFLYICSPITKKALVAELVDALDSKSSSFGSVGSIPTQGTEIKPQLFDNK